MTSKLLRFGVPIGSLAFAVAISIYYYQRAPTEGECTAWADGFGDAVASADPKDSIGGKSAGELIRKHDFLGDYEDFYAAGFLAYTHPWTANLKRLGSDANLNERRRWASMSKSVDNYWPKSWPKDQSAQDIWESTCKTNFSERELQGRGHSYRTSL